MFGHIRPLHVGKFIPPPYAGIEAHVDTLLRALLPEISGTLVAGESPDPAQRDVAKLPYRALVARSYGKFASATISPGVLSLAQKELASGNCNLLHIHAPNPWGDFLALSCPKNIPVVMTWHSDIVRQRKLMLLYRTIQRRVLERVDRITIYTPKHYESSQQLKQVDVRSKVTFVPIGIDFSQLDKTPAAPLARIVDFARGRRQVLTVGRHVYYKGYEYLISAISRARSDVVLVMIGAGALTSQLKSHARELKVEDRVLFLGEADNETLAGALHGCDVFCLPSIAPSEGFGIASAEAMACGKPTIVCELNNGVNYLNQEGKTSLVVPPKNVEALAAAIDTLILDDALRARLGASAREWVRREFSVEAMKRGTIDLYQSLV